MAMDKIRAEVPVCKNNAILHQKRVPPSVLFMVHKICTLLNCEAVTMGRYPVRWRTSTPEWVPQNTNLFSLIWYMKLEPPKTQHRAWTGVSRNRAQKFWAGAKHLELNILNRGCQLSWEVSGKCVGGIAALECGVRWRKLERKCQVRFTLHKYSDYLSFFKSEFYLTLRHLMMEE